MFKRTKYESELLDLEAFDREVAELHERHHAEGATDGQAGERDGQIAAVALYALGPVPIRRG